MGSMNNWLAFSLSNQDIQPSQPHQTHISGDDVSAECYGIPADSSRPDTSFGILEAFNRSHHQPQDWIMKGLEFRESTSELSMLVGSSSNQSTMDTDEPKLEDFLGGHSSFSDHDHHKLPQGCNSISGGAYDVSGDYIYPNCNLQLPAVAAAAETATGGGLSSNGGGSIGLSMIKTWLRSQPSPAQLPEGNGVDMAVDNMLVAGAGQSAGGSQGLSLSMSTGPQTRSVVPIGVVVGSKATGGEASAGEAKQKGSGGGDGQTNGALEAVQKKSIDTFGQRTSIYRGVTRHRWTGRYEAHLWDNSCRREGQTRKGRQVYLGGYDKEDKAARAYDLAALKYWGTTTTTNFPTSDYEKELEDMKHMTRQEYVASLRRKSSGFSRGASIYRGVTRHHQHGRWQARIGRVAGNKDLYLGTFSTQEEAAEAYDIAAIKFRGLNAVTNFDMSRYNVKSILESSTLPIGGAAKRLKDVSEHTEASVEGQKSEDDAITSQLTEGISSYGSSYHHHGWPTIAFQQAQPLMSINYPYGVQQRGWCKQEQQDGTGIARSLHDLQQLHHGTNTHNFFQPATIHNLMSMDSSSSMEHSTTGSNSVIYNGSVPGSSGSYQGFMGGNSSPYALPISTVVVDQSQSSQMAGSFGDNEGKRNHENMMMSADPYSGRNLYYLSQQSALKENSYEQTSGYNAWMPTLAQPASSRPSNMDGSQGAPLFTVWNDA